MAVPDDVGEEIVDAVVGRVVVVVDLLRDDLLLLGHVGRIEPGEREIREDVDGEVEMVLEARGEAGGLAAGEGVEMPADRLEESAIW